MNKLLISMTASLALLAAGPAVAQESPESANTDGGYSDPAAAGTQNTNFNDQELKQFVEAQEGINEIRDEYMEKIEAADSQQKAQELQMEANDEMVSVIEDAGMDIPTYNSIATAYNSEPKVRNRIDALM
ncbi:DUF4168 domain-containing protein [Marinobacter orientalis]|uniref:DUF4168 domain-containing protein n=1 Tax=Marinobacter orientalis TaxID=1928859 RepID=A0A7Y0WTA0_9GAMM|nr:DUF4168 domain-containing protein [Marinobacter orientalis]NMT64540.1 DUF4168 domain-containing protein [Marinobacter orientalis]TGX50507.1 DUF4168 domain-containing protein [Marinobacter orientalis]